MLVVEPYVHVADGGVGKTAVVLSNHAEADMQLVQHECIVLSPKPCLDVAATCHVTCAVS